MARFSKKRRGFTFIEVMVVVVLFAVVGVSLFSSFMMGMKVWKKITDVNFAERKVLIAIARLSKELKNSFAYSPIGFFGDNNKVTFANIVGNNITNITYEFSESQGVLYRGRIDMSSAAETEAEDINVARSIVSGIKGFSFWFYGQDSETGNYAFLDNWNYTVSGMPGAVKVSCKVGDDYVLEKIIPIPVAR